MTPWLYFSENGQFLIAQSGDLRDALLDLDSLKHDLREKIDHEFTAALHKINSEFSKFFEAMFGGGSAKLKIKSQKLQVTKKEDEDGTPTLAEGEVGAPTSKNVGVDIEVHIPRKRVSGLEALSGGERSLVSIAVLFALVSVSPPPFLVLDEIDAALDERNARKFSQMFKEFSEKTQFVIVTHNRATMEVANVLYGVTMGEDGTSKVLSLKLE